MTNLNTLKLKKEIGFGFSSALLIFSYTLCIAAVTGQGLEAVLFTSVMSAICSTKLKNNVFCGNIYLLVPLIVVFTKSTPFAGILSACLGGVLFLAISKLDKKTEIPSPVIAGGAIGLALAGTILLTNVYFGIGAVAPTTIDMLKAYHSLGFHPHFMGLLTGTITLFTMITYPFKFKKLNRYIPAEFITIFIPFIINLFLNPDKSLTTINETASFKPLFTDFALSLDFFRLSSQDVSSIISTSLAIALLLFGFYCSDCKRDSVSMAVANILTGTSVKKHSVRGYGVIPCLVTVVVISVLIILFPAPLSRIPLHSVGAMLIVAGFQTLPFKTIGKIFKSNRIVDILVVFICAISFIVTDVTSAVCVCLLCALLLTKSGKELKNL